MHLGVFLAVLLLCFNASLQAQQVQQNVTILRDSDGSSGSTADGDYGNVDGDYVLREGDRILLKIYPADEYIKGGPMEIGSEGTVVIPLLGKVRIQGMTVTEAENYLADLIDQDYLVNPEVVIQLSRLQSKNTVVVLGEVKRPGTYPFSTATSNFTLLQAISEAGGFSPVANIKRIKIVRKRGGQSQVIRANAEKIIEGKDEDIPLEPNDVIHVSESLF